MTLEEIREIREKMSLEIVGMTTEEINNYYKVGKEEFLNDIAEMRKANQNIQALNDSEIVNKKTNFWGK